MKESVLQINCHHSSVLTRVHGRRKNKVAEPDSGPRLEDLLQWYTCRRSQWHVKKKQKTKKNRRESEWEVCQENDVRKPKV